MHVPLSFAQTAPGPFGLVLALLLSVLAAPGLMYNLFCKIKVNLLYD